MQEALKHRLSILHIVNWYPNQRNPFEALWIQRQIKALNAHCSNTVLHIQVVPSNRFSCTRESDSNFRQIIIEIPVRNWRVVEWLTTLLLVYYLMIMRTRKRYDILNFHIAYPLLTYWHLLRKFYKIPVVINEHWSAYHFDFNVRQKEKLHRIRKIFTRKIPVITVSKSLLDDLRRFANDANFQSYVIPNIVDNAVFKILDVPLQGKYTFFMLSLWKWPKDPFTIINAFSFLVKDGKSNFELRIGGYGPLEEAMKKLVIKLNLQNSVIFLGKLHSDEIANEMNKAQAFLHSSGYETFSVVCAEALCCGTPVIASSVGGIKELVDGTNGKLITANNTSAWYFALQNFVETCKFDRISISKTSQHHFSSESVGLQYIRALEQVYDQSHTSISPYS